MDPSHSFHKTDSNWIILRWRFYPVFHHQNQSRNQSWAKNINLILYPENIFSIAFTVTVISCDRLSLQKISIPYDECYEK